MSTGSAEISVPASQSSNKEKDVSILVQEKLKTSSLIERVFLLTLDAGKLFMHLVSYHPEGNTTLAVMRPQTFDLSILSPVSSLFSFFFWLW